MNDKGALVRIFSGSLMDVEVIKSKLENIGIAAMIKNNYESGLHAGFGAPQNSVDLLVHEDDQERAFTAINEH